MDIVQVTKRICGTIRDTNTGTTFFIFSFVVLYICCLFLFYSGKYKRPKHKKITLYNHHLMT